MGIYNLEELIRRWRLGHLTIEQAIGQILLWLKDLSERLGELERSKK